MLSIIDLNKALEKYQKIIQGLYKIDKPFFSHKLKVCQQKFKIEDIIYENKLAFDFFHPDDLYSLRNYEKMFHDHIPYLNNELPSNTEDVDQKLLDKYYDLTAHKKNTNISKVCEANIKKALDIYSKNITKIKHFYLEQTYKKNVYPGQEKEINFLIDNLDNKIVESEQSKNKINNIINLIKIRGKWIYLLGFCLFTGIIGCIVGMLLL